MEKAAKCGTRVMSEDELLDLIREKTVKEKENKTPKTSPEKKEEVKADVKREKIQKADMISVESKVSIPKWTHTGCKFKSLPAKKCQPSIFALLESVLCRKSESDTLFVKRPCLNGPKSLTLILSFPY